MLKDPSVSQFDQIEEQDLQKKLAISLVVNLGFESAIHLSCEFLGRSVEVGGRAKRGRRGG